MQFNYQKQTILSKELMKKIKKVYRVYKCLTIIFNDNSQETLCYNYEDTCKNDMQKIKI